VDSAFQAVVELVQAGCGKPFGEALEPVVDLVCGQPLDLVHADLRDKVLVDENPVRLDGAVAEVASSLLEPVADGVRNRVAVAGVDAAFQVIDGPDESFFDVLLGAAFLLDPDAVTAAVVPKVDDSGVAGAFGIDRAVVVSDQDLHRLPHPARATVTY
jgi:hypothetical protein